MAKRGPTSQLEEPGVRDELAMLRVEGGNTLKEIADHFGVTRQTVGKWLKDPRVLDLMRKMRQDRVDRITQKVDATIDARLREADGLSVRELIELRKTYAPESTTTGSGKSDDEDALALFEELSRNPDVAQAIRDQEEDQSVDYTGDAPQE